MIMYHALLVFLLGSMLVLETCKITMGKAQAMQTSEVNSEGNADLNPAT